MNKLRYIAIVCAGMLSSLSAFADDGVMLINPEFYNEEQAAEYLTDSDYLNNFGTFDVQSRLRCKDCSAENVKAFVAKQVSPWDEESVGTIQRIISYLNKNIESNGYKLPLPAKVPFMLTTMAEEGDCMAYTRKEGIAIKSSATYRVSANIVAHELFHVLTRNNPEFKAAMYELIGFKTLKSDIAVPESFKNMMISNPDVEHHNTYATFKIDGKDVDCAMFIYSDREWTGRSFFDYLNIGLLEIDKEKCTLILKDGKPVIHRVGEAEDFFDKVGVGTDYIIDPEEILADNFGDVMCNYTGSELTKSMHELLQK